MSIEIFALIFILFTFAFLLSGIPAGFVLSGNALLFALLGSQIGFFDTAFLQAIPNRIFGIMSNQNLLAVPLFIFMGLILEKTKIAEELLESMNKLYSNTSGGLAISVVLVGVLMGASTGIVGASVVTLGLLSLPVMLKNNYPKSLSCGVICASGTLGQIIPPSLVLILLADVISSAYQQAQLNMGIFSPETVTISDLFAGALLPGLLLPMIYIFYIKSLKINSVTIPYKKDNPMSDVKIVRSLIAPIFLIIIVLGSIIFGIATPSEAASLGAVGAILLSILKNKLKLSIIKITSLETIKLTSMVFLILIGATFFSLVFRGYGGDEIVAHFLTNITGGILISIIITMLAIFILGFFLEVFEIIYVVVPIIGPAILMMGVDPLWFAIMIAVNLQTSFLTPPFGFALFYLRGVAPKSVKTLEIYKGAMPFVCIQIIMLVILWQFPKLATYLPKVIYG